MQETASGTGRSLQVFAFPGEYISWEVIDMMSDYEMIIVMLTIISLLLAAYTHGQHSNKK